MKSLGRYAQVSPHEERYHDDDRVDDRDHAGLRRGEQPAQYAPDDHERYEKGNTLPPAVRATSPNDERSLTLSENPKK